MQLVLQVNPEQLAALTEELRSLPHGLERVVTRAINKVAGHLYAETIRRIAQASHLMPSRIRRYVRLRRARWADMQAIVRIRGGRIPLIEAHARQTKRGVTFQALEGLPVAVSRHGAAFEDLPGSRGRSLIEHAFIALMPTGYRGVFIRRDAARLPIDELYIASPVAVFQGAYGLAASLLADAGSRLSREIDVQVQVLLDQNAALAARAASTRAAFVGRTEGVAA